MLIDIDRIVVSDRIRKDFGDIQELADDIKDNGLINPPVVNKEYVLLAGERRLRACKMLGWPQIEVRMMDTRDAEHELNIEISENDVRKGFTKSERVDYIKRLLRIEQAKAKERQGERTSDRNLTEVQRADSATAEQFGISRDTMRRELFIADNVDMLDPADFADWDEGKLSTNKAYQRIKAAKEQAERERDAARADAATARKVGETLKRQRDEAREEVTALEKQNDELYDRANAAQQPQVIERVVESDAAKKRIRDLEHERDLYLGDVQKLRRRNEDMRKELDKAKVLIGEKQRNDSAEWDIAALTAATNNYLRQYGGKAWAFDQFYRVDEVTRAEFVKAINNLAAFAQNLAQMIKEQTSE